MTLAEVILELGNGVLAARENRQLARELADGSRDAAELYQELIRIAYRLQFFSVARRRGLRPDDETRIHTAGAAAVPDGALCRASQMIEAGLDSTAVDAPLGSEHEHLLELHPAVAQESDGPKLSLERTAHRRRKSQGSYFTPPELVRQVLDSALDPAIEAALACPTGVRSLLALRVCDPACGAGYFLISAARRMAARIAAIRTRDDSPGHHALLEARREVIPRTLYGVDLDPLAVDLSRLNLWLEMAQPGLPLTFLDHRLCRGNSLLGATPAVISRGIPDAALEPLRGDNAGIARRARDRNRAERAQLKDVSETERTAAISAPVADGWCAAFLLPRNSNKHPPVTTATLLDLARRPDYVPSALRERIAHLAAEHHFFHWELRFPSVFPPGRTTRNGDQDRRRGFDVILGNPPWERLTIAEEEWFAARDAEIAATKGRAARRERIQRLAASNPRLQSLWDAASRRSQAYTRMLSRAAGRFPLTGRGELNTYHLFTELAAQLLASDGRAGLIVKTGISSANNALPLFQQLTHNGQLQSLFDFVNTRRLFPDVQSVERFSIIIFRGPGEHTARRRVPVRFASLIESVDELRLPGRIYSLSPAEIRRLSPLNGAAPLLRSSRDAKILTRIYESSPVLGESDPRRPGDFWNLSYVRVFDMANHSAHFRRYEELVRDGWELTAERRFHRGDGEYWPLLEGKYLYLMEHRLCSFDNIPAARRFGRKASPPRLGAAELADPYRAVMPRYWCPRELWERRRLERGLRGDYQFHFRDVTGAHPDVRSAIGAICPAGPAGDNAPALILPGRGDARQDAAAYLAFAALFCSLPFDYIARNKLFSKHLKWNTLGQLPMPPPRVVLPSESASSLTIHLQRVALELSFTTWSLASFGRDAGAAAPFCWRLERRDLLFAELDAVALHLYGLSREDTEHILTAFPTLARREQQRFGEFRTRRQVLSAYDRLAVQLDRGAEVHDCPLDPPPSEPRVAHAEPVQRPGAAVASTVGDARWQLRGGIGDGVSR